MMAERIDPRQYLNRSLLNYNQAAWNARRTPGMGLGGRMVMLDSLARAKQASDADTLMKIDEANRAQRNKGYEARIQTIEQTNLLGAQADRNAKSITDAIAAQTVAMNDGFCAIKERELQSKIDSLTAQNTALRGQIDNAAQTAQIAAMLAPIQSEVNAIKASQPNTVPVQWPNLMAVNNTPFYGYGYGNAGSYWG